MQRLQIVDQEGKPIGDSFVVGAFNVPYVDRFGERRLP
jgi:hypothetical protein